jgi:dsDNA-specific endonuclease/ATPase MutS2
MLSRQELIEMGKTARQERDRLLNEHPELKEFQQKIDRCLDNAGSSENRMAVLGIMIEAKLKDLRDELSHLSLLMRQYKIPNHASDE